MAKKPLPTPAQIRQLLRYEPDTGKLFWRERGPEWFTDGYFTAQTNANRWNRLYAGVEAFTNITDGYKRGSVLSHGIRAHRVAWAIYTGGWPSGHIDHINGVRDDNRIVNLRDIPPEENQRNMGLAKNNQSGAQGVHLDKRNGRWVAQCRVEGKATHVGCFQSLQDAAEARERRMMDLPFHRNHGSIRPTYIKKRSRY